MHQLTDTFGLTKDNYLAAMKEVRGNQRVTDDNPEGKYQTLEKYGTDLTARARAGKIDPVIGRDTEIRRVLQILSRRTKNNPVLIGEPGVGKPPLRKVWRGALSTATCRKACATSALYPSTSAPCLPEPNIAVNLKNA